ncbi:hypothetical protein FHL15_009888 [Xylaria flabelliformis]|uniref:Uncharacterized protein n=1 Tax=Xylaria flabelliformis TaxID=2512241 RepID=A0A553HMK2_9PEZI|nr:hypothetical protein FHL15_009888 [Xylaria flabelliformis]
MVVASSDDPQARLTDLAANVERLEAAFASDFADWGKLNLPSAAHYFQVSYAEVIDILASISAEERAKDVTEQLQPQLKALFGRCVDLLSESICYAKKVSIALRPVHKLLLSDVRRFNKRHDLNSINGLLDHLVNMSCQLADIRPPAREAWTDDGNDLKPDEEFDAVFQRFRDLDTLFPRKTQDDYELYARESWIILLDACRTLHIPEIRAQPGDHFFDNETRPTYVDYPQASDEALYGQGKRPGILTVKSNLGGPLLEKQEKGIKQAKKREAESVAQSANKRPRNEVGYSMTIVNATADLEDVFRDSQFLTPKDDDIARPGTKRLVTPTCENRKQLLATYRDDLRTIADRLYKRKFKTPLTKAMLPSTAEDRAAWLKTAADEIRESRATVNLYIDGASSPAKAKKLRLAAYTLKLARAIYMIGLLSGTPPASHAEIKTALRDRLDDWILHERAWTVGDQYLLSRAGLTSETLNVLESDIKKRDANIKEWRRMQNELDGNADKNQNDSNDDTKEQQQQQEPSPTDPHGGPVLTKTQIKNANQILSRVLNPRLPSGGDYARDVAEEGRRRRYYTQVAAAKLRGQPIPKWEYKKVVDPFKAGGPPGWEDLPTETYWDRLKYMWILSFWRLYQLKELDP